MLDVKRRLKPRARFGRSETVIQSIIAAHARFVGAYRYP